MVLVIVFSDFRFQIARYPGWCEGFYFDVVQRGKMHSVA